tara:strand:+ start:14989 stop:15750 length:762 start_codon:yes stop_codon:yes gene_type:complete
MPEQMSLDDFALACGAAETPAALWWMSLDYFQGRGIGRVSYHANSPDGPAIEGQDRRSQEYGEGWHCTYLDADLRRVSPIDPLARRRGQPFRWSEVARLTRLTKKEARYMQDLALQCPYDGLAMQVYGPRDEAAVVGLGFGPRNGAPDAVEIFELHCAAQIAQLRFCALTEAAAPRDVALSPREVEVLEWIARGKSNTVIADILGISRHTVDTIVRRVFSKLDVHDRTTAAIRGLGAGLLHTMPNDPSGPDQA